MNKSVFEAAKLQYYLLYLFSIVFIIVTLFFVPWLAVLEILFLACHIVFTIYFNKKNQSRVYNYLKTITLYLDEATRENLTNFPMPITILNEHGDIVWYNDIFENVLKESKLDDYFGKNFDIISKDISLENVANDKQSIYDIVFADKYYTIYFIKQGTRGKDMFYAVYWMENDAIKKELASLKEKRPCVAYFVLDSYDEIPEDVTELQKSTFITRVDSKMRFFAKSVNGLLKKLENDKYFIIFEQKYLSSLEKSKFKILEDVKDISIENKVIATLSAGVSTSSINILENDAMARSALDMALSRGGDQVALLKDGKYIFYGGRSDGLDKRKRVKVRIIADSLSHQILSSDGVLIMGHKYADLDCVGAQIGVLKCAQALGKKAQIIYNPKENLCQNIIDAFKKEPEYKDVFIENDKIVRSVYDNYLLIIVDTHSYDYIENADLAKSFKNVVIIDHHRRLAENAITDTVIAFHEPNASSTCEMVSELCDNIVNIKIAQKEANALLAGIILDTKNFTERTGVRTFEAAAYLKRRGADVQTIKQYFKSDFESYKKMIDFINSAEIYKECAISKWDNEGFDQIKIVASKAADELLKMNGVHATFVAYKENGFVHISARADTEFNVSVIMEKFGGGGHRFMAGAQIETDDIDKIINDIKIEIDNISEEEK